MILSSIGRRGSTEMEREGSGFEWEGARDAWVYDLAASETWSFSPVAWERAWRCCDVQ